MNLNNHKNSINLDNNFPFLRIIRNFYDYPKKEQDELKRFLYEIGFDDYFFEIYLELVDNGIDIKQINYEDVKNFKLKIDFIFINLKTKSLEILEKNLKNEKFSSLLPKLSFKNKVNELILEYIFQALKSLVIDYETKRISAGIFNIVK